MTKNKKTLPLITVIIPVYNGRNKIGNLLDSLMDQSYPKSLMEIIVIDNYSTDNPEDIVKKYPVKLLEENDIRSSYAARNKGIKAALGDILAFTDSDCTATYRWIEEGVKMLDGGNTDIVGGRVEFTFSDKKTIAEQYDSMTNMQIEKNIRERGVAKTANLFVRASVFSELGDFPTHVKSGGDVYWTSRATASGYSIKYAPDAVVKHPARNLIQLMKKQFRVGTGIKCALHYEEKSAISFLSTAISKLLYGKIPKEKKLIDIKDSHCINSRFPVTLWIVFGLCYVSTGLGIIFSLFPWRKYHR